MNIDNYKIAAVVVTFDRLDLLKECINSIRRQTRKLDEIIVVNNSSTDGTFEWLTEQNDLTVITQDNSGSAGGQYMGIKSAYEKGYDWIWCMDCDVIAESTALSNLLNYKEILPSNTGFLSSTIYYKDGQLAHANIPELDQPYNVLNSIALDKSIPIITASFGSVIFPRNVIKKVGLPSKEFFIWGDDAEYTLRIIQNGFKGYMILESRAVHMNFGNDSNPYKNISTKDVKFRYGVRNMVYISILRNKIVVKSKLRGIISGALFVVKIYKQKKDFGNKSKLFLAFDLIILFVEGIRFKPTIDYVI